jgi:hypothetical protein
MRYNKKQTDKYSVVTARCEIDLNKVSPQSKMARLSHAKGISKWMLILDFTPFQEGAIIGSAGYGKGANALSGGQSESYDSEGKVLATVRLQAIDERDLIIDIYKKDELSEELAEDMAFKLHMGFFE